MSKNVDYYFEKIVILPSLRDKFNRVDFDIIPVNWIDVVVRQFIQKKNNYGR